MNEFYRHYGRDSHELNHPGRERSAVENIALRYGDELYDWYEPMLRAKSASTSPYYVGLSSGIESFTHVTKRVALVADTMLLSDHGGSMYELPPRLGYFESGNQFNSHIETSEFRRIAMLTRDLAELGQWLLDAEPLLRRGLMWYGPTYMVGANSTEVLRFDGHEFEHGQIPAPSIRDRSFEFLIEHGRAVDLTRAKPLASRVVRPILEVDLPFIDGLSVSDFAQVTSDEFDCYRQYRDFMRSRLLELDDALEAVDSQVALERIALAIRDELNAATAEMRSAARTRALSRPGAVLGTTSAVLAAVRPEALQGALATGATLAAGATGLWPTIQAFADTKAKHAHGKWHYVWALQKKAAR